MQIGYFQLENLVVSKSRFLLFDLRPESVVTEALKSILVEAVSIPPNEVANEIKKRKLTGSDPVVLLCDDGTESNRLAKSLEQQGHQNVYVLRGGMIGMLAELAEG
jgi:rhodanese-related sulfurtransferase